MRDRILESPREHHCQTPRRNRPVWPPYELPILEETEKSEMNNKPDADLLKLAAEGGDRSRKEASRRIRKMNSDQRRILRMALSRLDSLLDEVALELHLKRSRNGK
jgi:hypothetical protein